MRLIRQHAATELETDGDSGSLRESCICPLFHLEHLPYTHPPGIEPRERRLSVEQLGIAQRVTRLNFVCPHSLFYLVILCISVPSLAADFIGQVVGVLDGEKMESRGGCHKTLTQLGLLSSPESHP